MNLNTIITLVYLILVLSIIIIIHEVGHLLAAKKFNVYCKEFSIGMGPKLYMKKFGETSYSLRALPIGGAVAMAGEIIEDGDKDENDDLDIPFERTINGIAKWKQIIVMFAGPFMNIILAWGIFIGISAYQGAVVVPSEPIVDQVSEGSVAQEAGFISGDKIIKMEVNGEVSEPKTFDEVVEFIQYYKGETNFSVERDNKVVELKCTPKFNEESKAYMIGVGAKSNIKEITIMESFKYGTEQLVDSSTMIFRSLANLVRGVGLDNLSGPIGIFQATDTMAQQGIVSFIAFIGLLSINVGIFNLLPIPILDGGRILILLLEGITRRKFSEKILNGIMMFGLFAIVGIMVFATWNDIIRLFQ